MKSLTLDELLLQFEPSVHDQIRAIAAKPATTYLVMYENHMLDSPRLGERTTLRVGPDCTVKTLEQARTTKLGELVSDMQVAVAYVVLNENADLTEAAA